MMLAYYFVQLIETHSCDLASQLLEKVQESSCTRAYSNVPPKELRQRVYEIYEHLGDWLWEKKKWILSGAIGRSAPAATTSRCP